MTTTEPTPPVFDGTRRSMFDIAAYPFGQWWSTLPTGAHIGLILAFMAATSVVIWWAVRHERRHTTSPKTPKKLGQGRNSGPGT